jgi:enoyl-CoA hydratase/carnithine racemase
MPAAEALARGLIGETADAATLDDKTHAAAALLGGKPANAFALNKRWLRRPLVAALHAAEDEHARLRASGDMH